jgi:hypothetical protein
MAKVPYSLTPSGEAYLQWLECEQDVRDARKSAGEATERAVNAGLALNRTPNDPHLWEEAASARANQESVNERLLQAYERGVMIEILMLENRWADGKEGWNRVVPKARPGFDYCLSVSKGGRPAACA